MASVLRTAMRPSGGIERNIVVLIPPFALSPALALRCVLLMFLTLPRDSVFHKPIGLCYDSHSGGVQNHHFWSRDYLAGFLLCLPLPGGAFATARKASSKAASLSSVPSLRAASLNFSYWDFSVVCLGIGAAYIAIASVTR